MIDIPTGTYTVKRYVAGKWNDEGRFDRGTESTFEVEASVQPLSGNMVKLLPEHRRTAESILIYLEEELRTSKESEKLPADIFVYQGKNFEVFTVKNWSDITDIPHFEVVAVRQDI
jgi:hypothetical protein